MEGRLIKLDVTRDVDNEVRRAKYCDCEMVRCLS